VARSQRKRRALAAVGKLTLLGFSLFVALCFGELLLRIVGFSPAVMSPLTSFHRADPEIGWLGVPTYEARFKTLNFDVRVELNEEGFRRKQSEVEAEEDAAGIWLFGDSFAWGWGVNNGELWSDHLQTLGGPEYRVTNHGINAFGTVQQLLLLRRRLETGPAPSDVVILVCVNDFIDNLSDQGGVRPFVKRDEITGEWRIANTPVRKRVGGMGTRLRRNSYALTFLA